MDAPPPSSSPSLLSCGLDRQGAAGGKAVDCWCGEQCCKAGRDPGTEGAVENPTAVNEKG